MMTLGRITGKVVKNSGWWQLLLLGGVWAWFSTQVGAQQTDVSNKPVRVARGFEDRNESDSYPQSGFLGRSAIPRSPRNESYRNDQYRGDLSRDEQEIQRPSRQGRTRSRIPVNQEMQFERIDLRPNHAEDWEARSRLNDASSFVNPRPHRTNRNSDPDFLDPTFQAPANRRLDNRDFNERDSGYGDSEDTEGRYRDSGRMNPRSSGYLNSSLPNRSFQNPNVPALGPRTIPQEAPVNPLQEIQTKITRRYQNQGFLSLLNLPPQQSVALYREVLGMIDTRHLEPAPLQARVQRGITNLVSALDNPTFVQTNQLSLSPAGVQSFRAGMQQALQSPIQSDQDAINMMNWTMQVSQQQIGLRPAATALEFVYGAVEALDKYSAFVPPEKNSGASLQMESSMVGIGVQIEMRDQGAEVLKVISGGPAQGAGIRKGDMILAVAGRQLSGLTVDQTVDLISGSAGSPVVLGIQRPNQGLATMTVTRQAIQLHSVNDIQVLSGSRVGYFKLDKFTATANEEIENALQQLYRQGMQSLVVDLRGNPGGLLTAAIQISDKFLPEGTIVATRGRTPSDNTEEHATRDHTWKIPLVVLVDHNSASASEIFAAAIQENGRGVVVGRPSYGKGTVQTQFPLQTAGCSLRITTAKFYSPAGREMAGKGVIPDVPVAEDLNGENPALGVLDHDVQAALSVAQQGGFSNPNGSPSRFPAENQNLSSIRNRSQPQVAQPFSQPRSPSGF